MSKSRRPSKSKWNKIIRPRIWERDGHKCVKCGEIVLLESCHIDHVEEVIKGGSSLDDNLRTLCSKCHVLRKEATHRGMMAWALSKGLIKPGWREDVW